MSGQHNSLETQGDKLLGPQADSDSAAAGCARDCWGPRSTAAKTEYRKGTDELHRLLQSMPKQGEEAGTASSPDHSRHLVRATPELMKFIDESSLQNEADEARTLFSGVKLRQFDRETKQIGELTQSGKSFKLADFPLHRQAQEAFEKLHPTDLDHSPADE